MTLNDIIVSALAQLDRGHDAQSLDVWRDKFTRFANDGVTDICVTYKPRRTETIDTRDGTFTTAMLSRGCRKVLSVKRDGREEDFYDGEIKPFYVQLAQALTNCIFSKKERGYGNEITVEGNKLQFARTSDKLAVVKYLSDIGGLMLDQALTTLGYPPIGGEEGKRRVQTLNVVNANKADEYQLGTDTKKEEPPEDGNDDGEGTAPTAAPDGKKDEEER